MAYTSGMMNKRVTVARRAADAASGYGKGAGGVRYSILGEFWAAEDYNKGVKSLREHDDFIAQVKIELTALGIV